MKKLLILDCDGVLYNHRELDVNAMVYAFNIVCDELDAEEYKFTRIIHCTEDKPIKGFYNYIRYTSNKLSIDMDEFIEKMIDKIDYSRIERDSDGILDILDGLHSNYEICVCTNNHKKHLDRILEVKFNLTSDNFPYPCFDVTFSEIQGKYYPKQSPEFISKIESYFDIKPSDIVPLGIKTCLIFIGIETSITNCDYLILYLKSNNMDQIRGVLEVKFGIMTLTYEKFFQKICCNDLYIFYNTCSYLTSCANWRGAIKSS